MITTTPITDTGHGRPEIPHRVRRPRALQAASTLLGGLTLCSVGLTALAAGYLVNASTHALVIGFVAWVLASLRGVFHLHITRDDLFKLGPILSSTMTGMVVAVCSNALLFRIPSRLSDVVATGLLILLGMVVGLQIGRRVLLSMWRRGEYRTTAVVVGAGDVARQLRLELAHRPDLGIDVVGHLTMTGEESDGEALAAIVDQHRPDRLIMGEPGGNEQELLPALRRAGTLGTRVYVLPRLFEMGLGNPLFTPDRLRGYPLLRANRSVHPQLSFALKRIFDVSASAVGLVLVSPLLAVAAIAVRLSSPGPILFWQERVGLNGMVFSVPKLRSMSGGETGDTDWTAESRITPVGRILRRTAIDELPQLWTVLRGDMSLVGPRPERPAFVEKFESEHPGYSDRLRMRAGLTGLSQIAGLRGDTPIAERSKYDNLYIDQWSFSGDLAILFRTIIAIAKEGSYAQEHLDLDEVMRLDETSTSPAGDEIDVRATGNDPVDLRPSSTQASA